MSNFILKYGQTLTSYAGCPNTMCQLVQYLCISRNLNMHRMSSDTHDLMSVFGGYANWVISVHMVDEVGFKLSALLSLYKAERRLHILSEIFLNSPKLFHCLQLSINIQYTYCELNVFKLSKIVSWLQAIKMCILRNTFGLESGCVILFTRNVPCYFSNPICFSIPTKGRAENVIYKNT